MLIIRHSHSQNCIIRKVSLAMLSKNNIDRQYTYTPDMTFVPEMKHNFSHIFPNWKVPEQNSHCFPSSTNQ